MASANTSALRRSLTDSSEDCLALEKIAESIDAVKAHLDDIRSEFRSLQGRRPLNTEAVTTVPTVSVDPPRRLALVTTAKTRCTLPENIASHNDETVLVDDSTATNVGLRRKTHLKGTVVIVTSVFYDRLLFLPSSSPQTLPSNARDDLGYLDAVRHDQKRHEKRFFDRNADWRKVSRSAPAELVTDPGMIWKHYIRGWLLFDLIASFPFTWLAPESSGAYDSGRWFRLLRFTRFLRLFRLLRLAKLIHILGRIEEFLEVFPIAHFAASISKMILWIVLLSHVSACVWFSVGLRSLSCDKPSENLLQCDWEESWMVALDRSELENSDSFKLLLYLNALYFTLSTMTTVGYGDIHPVSSGEKAFTAFFLLVSIVAFSGMVGAVTEVVHQFFGRNVQHKSAMLNLGRYMKWRRLPYHLQRRLRRYMQYRWEHGGLDLGFKESEIMRDLSPALRISVLARVYGPPLKEARHFKWLVRHQLAFERLLAKVKFATQAPGDVLFLDSELDDCLYFLQVGQLGLFYSVESGEGYPECVIVKAPAHVGQTALRLLATNKPSERENILRPCSALCSTHCELLTISIDDLKTLLDSMPKLWQEFAEWYSSEQSKLRFYEEKTQREDPE
ncbi:hypothetical protein FOZ60_017218 [Perkinsus olseni]|uniref:Ion transport domain-containing protein n=2 Tax=Perkinsus olseni TaxID=32597 RepID=A0A7J6P4A4_PEROL|nr:hypothetical protein FOZ60_017218 [Perkinsus olseni]